MEKWGYVVLLTVLTGALASCSTQPEASKPGDLVTSAKEFIELLTNGNFSKAVERFDGTMKVALPPEKLQEVWKSLTTEFCSFKRQLGTKTEKVQGHDVVFVTCEFEKTTLDARIVFDPARRVSGLWFAPSESSLEYKPPAYVKPTAFQENEVTVGTGEWALPGTLTIPKGTGPFPAVVLVHGSGPLDRDETVGPNKPFRDLAWGLASQGIAVLRYEKRTKKYMAKIASSDKITVKEETTDDALAAVSLLRSTQGIDSKRIFVLGHSLGGMLIPRIAKADPNIAGLIVMAGTTRPIEDVILEQTTYLFSLKGSTPDADKEAVGVIKRQVARVKDPKLSTSTPAKELPFGIPAAYWLDLKGYDPPRAAKELKQPMLILQGGRDYQVTMADFQRWKDALSARQDVTFKLYPKLNHLFVEGEGKSTPAEYERPGHVAEVVVNDIAGWVRQH